MSWRGKAIGGSIGSFFGPLGTLAGAAAGHFLVDRKKHPSEKQALRLLALAAGTFHELAIVDGRYSVKEDQVIRSILSELNHLLGTRLAQHELVYLIDDAARIGRCHERLAASARDTPPLARDATTWLWRVAVSDGDPASAEIAFIDAFSRHAGLPAESARQVAFFYNRQAATPSSGQSRQEACSVLGVPYHATPAQIKSAYRNLSLTYHPDKHAALDPAIQALTSEKFSQVKAAYDTLSGQQTLNGYCRTSADHIAPAAAGSAAACFLCGQQTQLPDNPGHLPSARCPTCQALLTFDREIAEQLTRRP